MVNSLNQDSEDHSNEQPWWVGSVYKIGIPSAICIGLVWFLAAKVQAKLDEIDYNVKAQQSLLNLNIDKNDRMLRIMQQICINSSSTNDERVKCFQ